ncbi:MAG: hypothetical protein U1G05_13665 [Kiritimatiellia bacterium]
MVAPAPSKLLSRACLVVSITLLIASAWLGKKAALANVDMSVTGLAGNPWYLAVLACLGVHALVWPLALRTIPLSIAYAVVNPLSQGMEDGILRQGHVAADVAAAQPAGGLLHFPQRGGPGGRDPRQQQGHDGEAGGGNPEKAVPERGPGEVVAVVGRRQPETPGDGSRAPRRTRGPRPPGSALSGEQLSVRTQDLEAHPAPPPRPERASGGAATPGRRRRARPPPSAPGCSAPRGSGGGGVPGRTRSPAPPAPGRPETPTRTRG